jgi:hypothetical protein
MEWLLALYQMSHSDVRWCKEQGWRAVSWTFALFGAISALYRYPFAKAPLCPFVIIVLAIMIAFAFYARGLQSFAKEARERSDKIEARAPVEVRDLLASRGTDPNYEFLLYIQIAIVALASGVTIAGLRWIHQLQ